MSMISIVCNRLSSKRRVSASDLVYDRATNCPRVSISPDLPIFIVGNELTSGASLWIIRLAADEQRGIAGWRGKVTKPIR